MIGRQQVRYQFKTREEALYKKQALELEKSKGPGQSMQLTSLNPEEMREAESAALIIKKAFPSKSLGLMFAANYLRDNYSACESNHTIATILETYIAYKAPRVRSVQLRTISGYLRSLNFAFPSIKLHEFTTKMIEGWLVARAHNPKTWNNIRGDVSAFFRWLSEESNRLIPKNPVRLIETKVVAQHLPEILTVDQTRLILERAEKWENGCIALPVALTLFAGIRPDGEMAKIADTIEGKLPAQYFNTNGSRIFMDGKITKTHAHRWIDMPENLIAWVKSYPLNSNNISNRLIKKKLPEFRKSLEFKVPHNALRHSFVSYYRKLHGAEKAAEAAGHDTKMASKHYLNLDFSEADAREYFNIIPTIR